MRDDLTGAQGRLKRLFGEYKELVACSYSDVTYKMAAAWKCFSKMADGSHNAKPEVRVEHADRFGSQTCSLPIFSKKKS